MCCVYNAQFCQHVEFREQLLGTGSARIVFMDNFDATLGSGSGVERLLTRENYGGYNWLGKSLMKVRRKYQLQVSLSLHLFNQQHPGV